MRSVLTTEQQTDKYAASMETAAAAKEDALFSNVSSTSTAKPAGFSNDNNNLKASKLNGAVGTAGNKRVGPAIVLKVMTGDTASISTWSWYSGAVQPAATGVADIATELLPLLTGGVSGAGGSKGGAILSSYSDPLLSGDLRKFLDSNHTYVNTRPKAFLNWMVVDEEFAGVKSANHMSAVQIPVCNAGDTLKQVVGLNQMVIRRNGWIYIYLSNESNQDVFFDNLVVNLTHGPLVEQKDYYAFGMEIPGLCTQALKYKYNPNRLTYNGKESQSKEFADTTGLNWDDYGARMYDPQIGRWMSPDPLAEKMRRYTPYNYAIDNPVRFVDPDGMDASESLIDWNARKEREDQENGHGTNFNFGSGTDEGSGNTHWTNNNNGTFSGDNGQTASTGEQDDDIIHVNSKTKEAEVTKTNDNFDMVSVDGAKPVKVDEKGKTVADLRKSGYWVGNAPEGVGDGSFWGALLWLGGEKLGSWLVRGFSGLFVKAATEEVVTNLIPEGELANHLFKGVGKLADNAANRTLIQTISNGKALGVDPFGKSWYNGIDAAGNAIYSYTQNSVVKGAGYMTMTPAEMIIKYNLK